MSRPKHIKETRFEYLKRTAIAHEQSETPDACLIWPFGATSGYGVLAWNPIPDYYPRARVPEKAHRVAYYLRHGKLPMPCGLHSCDDPMCYNWRHISPGDDMRNAAERVQRGLAKGAKGVANAAAKVTDDLVIQMRRDSAVMTQKGLCEKYRLHRRTVRSILMGTSWSHVAMPPETKSRYKDAYGVNDGSKKLDEQAVRAIRDAAAKGVTHNQLSATYKVNRITIGRIVRRVRWAHVA